MTWEDLTTRKQLSFKNDLLKIGNFLTIKWYATTWYRRLYTKSRMIKYLASHVRVRIFSWYGALGIGRRTGSLALPFWTLAGWWFGEENHMLLAVHKHLETSWYWRKIHIQDSFKDLNYMTHRWPMIFIILDTPTSQFT